MTQLERYRTFRIHWFIALLLIVISVSSVVAQRPAAKPPADPLEEYNNAVEGLVKKVWPSVVQVLVTSFGPRQESDRGQTSVVVGRQRSVASGFVIDPDGYIMTNAHV